MINEICDLFTQDAPEITKKLPVSWVGESESPTYLDFIRRLALETNEVLELGDSLVAHEDIPYSQKNCGHILNAWGNIRGLIDGTKTNINKYTKDLPTNLHSVLKFYALRADISIERAQQHDGELNHFQNVTKPSLLNQGAKGHAILYSGLDPARPDHLQKGTVSLAEYANWQNEQKEVIGYYYGADEMNPAMLGIGGKAPKEIELEDSISSCGQDEQRHKETAQAILTLINKLSDIGLTVKATYNQEDQQPEAPFEDSSPSAS